MIVYMSGFNGRPMGVAVSHNFFFHSHRPHDAKTCELTQICDDLIDLHSS